MKKRLLGYGTLSLEKIHSFQKKQLVKLFRSLLEVLGLGLILKFIQINIQGELGMQEIVLSLLVK